MVPRSRVVGDRSSDVDSSRGYDPPLAIVTRDQLRSLSPPGTLSQREFKLCDIVLNPPEGKLSDFLFARLAATID